MGGRGSGRKPKATVEAERIDKRLTAAVRRGDMAVTREIQRMFSEIDPDDPGGRSRLEVAVRKMYDLGTKGCGPGYPPSIKALQELFDRIEGKPVQSVSMDVTQRSPEEHVESILRALEALKPEKSEDDEHRPARVN